VGTNQINKSNKNKKGDHMIELIIFFDTIIDFMTLQKLKGRDVALSQFNKRLKLTISNEAFACMLAEIL